MNRLKIWDKTLSTHLTMSRTSPHWPLTARLAHLGDGTLVLVVMGLALFEAMIFHTPLVFRAVMVLLGMMIVTAVVVTLIKYSLRRQRPGDPTGFVSFSYDKYSFPSGHSARMSCVAVTILFFNLPVGLLLLALALLVALSRVVIGVHYLSDILVGLTIGALVPALLIWQFGLTR